MFVKCTKSVHRTLDNFSIICRLLSRARTYMLMEGLTKAFSFSFSSKYNYFLGVIQSSFCRRAKGHFE